jgi:hypothetical protein
MSQSGSIPEFDSQSAELPYPRLFNLYAHSFSAGIASALVS